MLSRKEILVEFGNCLKDPGHVIETYFETFDLTQKKFVSFKLFPRQKDIIKAYEKHRFNLVTKPRQAGVSTTTAAYFAVKAGFADSTSPEAILIIANKQELAFEFLAKVKLFVSQIPRWVWGPDYYGNEKNEKREIFLTDSKGEIKLPNGSRVKAVATSKDALRGFAPTYLVMDEAAYIDNGAEVFGAAMTALGAGGRCYLISTPQGLDELYYRTYEQSKAKKNDFNIIEMKWYEDLRYNKGLTWRKDDVVIEEFNFTFESYEEMVQSGYKPTSPWYEEMCRGLNNDPKMIAQELDVSFIGSGGNVIDDEYIEIQEKQNVQEPKFISGAEKEIWIWQEPIVGHKYLLGSDVSRGDGADYSTIVIVDFTTMEQVMEYHGRIPPDELAQLIETYGNMYNALTIVDITGGTGVPTILKLLEFNYKNIYYDETDGKIFSTKEKQLDAYKKGSKTPGFQFGRNRISIISNLEEKIRHNQITVRSIRLVNEMKTFIYRGGRADHSSGHHDDLLITLAMILWVLEHSFKKLEKVDSLNKAILNSWASNLTVDKNNDGKQVTKKYVPTIMGSRIQDAARENAWLFATAR